MPACSSANIAVPHCATAFGLALIYAHLAPSVQECVVVTEENNRSKRRRNDFPENQIERMYPLWHQIVCRKGDPVHRFSKLVRLPSQEPAYGDVMLIRSSARA